MSDSARAPGPVSQSLTRRTALRVGGRAALGAIAASTAASACAIRTGGTVPRTGAAGLVPVDVFWDRIIRRVVGLRPYRPAGFRLETILLPQPEVDYIVLQSGLYMFPRADGILLGGTFERGESSLEVNAEAERRIVEGHRRLFGTMRVT